MTLPSLQTHQASGQYGSAREAETRDAASAPGQDRPPASEAELIGRMLAARFKGHGADLKRSLWQLASTATPFIALLIVMGAASRGAYWLTLLLAIPTGGLLVRLFIIQHDCGHGSFFKSRAANDFLGRVLGVLTMTPYGNWRQGHALHHATNGNLDRRGRGDIDMLTVAEYQALTRPRRLAYRLYRNPFVMVLLGAPITFILLQRLPTGPAFRNREARRSIMWLNVALVAVFGLPMLLFGVVPVLMTYLPVTIISSWIGNWLFYVQHQFEDAYWERDGDWNFHAAAVRGSSYFVLPPVLRWFSGNIGMHHIHHLCSRIPNYRLRACFKSAPELARIAKPITLLESLRCWRLALWDEQNRLLVRFRDLKPQGA